MKNTCRKLRKVPVGRLCGGLSWRESCCARQSTIVEGRRKYFLMPFLKGVHDTFMGAIEMGGWITGRQPLPLRPRAGESGGQESRTAQSSRSIQRHFQTLASHQTWKVSSPKAPTANPDAETTLSEQLRSVFRLLTNPIVVCTATHNGTPRAMTMSSFTSLTLSPTPLVSFNIATPSRTLDAITSSKEFNIHVLASDESGAAVADHFTRGNMDGVFDTMEGATYTVDKCQHGRSSAPLLKGEGVLRVLRCKLLPDGATGGLVRVRDHVIVLGEVVEMIPGNKTKEFGLAYADRRYRQVGGVIENAR
ncbi:putative oxidoreductase [Metarhizium acridum CQMa 102]|uniref:Putative oxidoreductase n=2 Tax=Metarhizium acridum TaxID=92637 RepID=E9DWF7_METAQ|nr:putative oxidoreductase [Metarhizium acridum CQMa 102]EFY92007.1 putative oxidoreductase [Metarhizium acridum CQMa 102]